jgi:hypothetical protein
LLQGSPLSSLLLCSTDFKIGDKMPEPSELEKQSQALIAFDKSLGHCVSMLRWPYSKTMPEPVEHRTWRRYAGVVFRLDLFHDTGLADGLGNFAALAYEAQTRERSAWGAWCKRKAKLEMDLFTGKRKSLPWSC